MNQNKKLKLFISYSHLDEEYIKIFIKHIAPLKNNGLIEDWYDRKIVPGKDFQDDIDNNLEDADVICLFISSNFLSSDACIKEKKDALKLKNKKGISAVPIILSACGWLDDKELSSLLALPTDGKPISNYTNADEAWYDAYEGLKIIIKEVIKVKQLRVTDEFALFLQNTGMLSKAHSQKEKVLLDDIFVFPELKKYDDLREYEKKKSSKIMIRNLINYSKVLIAGENQSGKTTLCKKIFIELRKKNFVPVYISDHAGFYKGKIENIIQNEYENQYEGVVIDEIDKKRIVPIIDDFHFAKNKEKHIQDLSSYSHQIIVVDDIFSLNFKDENLIKCFTHFKIREFTPSLRNELIRKWTCLSDKIIEIQDENKFYECIDRTTELVNTSLGKVIGSGIMPSYPFFVLSVISTYETFGKPLDQEITSQGYCYQTLIYIFLRKQKVKNDEIDTYINFLTEFAFFSYEKKKNEISFDEFDVFLKSYLDKYNLPVNKNILLENLQQTQILIKDDFNNYSFCYRYLYYYFVAKYLAEHIEENKIIIDKIINNLHIDENAYISVFISHHSKNIYILEEILLNAYSLFDKYEPATLSKDELSFFDIQEDIMIKAVLPLATETPEKERANRLQIQDELEQKKQEEVKGEYDKNFNDLEVELRRSIKTVEVMGRIIKNRAGSLEKTAIENIFKEAVKVHLRILTSFFELIKSDEEQKKIIEFISDRLKQIEEEYSEKRKKEGRKERKLNKDELEKISKTIFWNTNLFFVFGLINKIIHSVGSNKMTEIIKKVCDDENTPSSFLIKHGILMWYNKNMQVENIAKSIEKEDFSDISKKIIKFMIVDHCAVHKVGYKEKQKIELKLGIPSKKLLIAKSKKNEND